MPKELTAGAGFFKRMLAAASQRSPGLYPGHSRVFTKFSRRSLLTFYNIYSLFFMEVLQNMIDVQKVTPWDFLYAQDAPGTVLVFAYD